ncbi:Cd(II)/Pb(II)-responsive transcriptional regulator [Desulfovibrio intestinalis]|uniref:Cd(II)/Pb(II)-responsive transcriptional regulator n=1 Tax=Desulfovibrio intestinalis TaxID=58621 RepID=A0A7W8FEW5_9BACT|nr:Cd(II)/Pb(II)-responsive transcriptional regulator [Desulfovibrio intestinalis]MBB5142175.1 Cd(II)/Pb(II)-responsive transcriptional regulator [Desulfovibrio intestinalis]
MKMKIGELAKMVGCKVVTIRFYEKEGLLKEPDRTGANYRLYGDKEIERLRFIRHCRRHGMTLSEIRELLAFRDTPKANCDWVGTLVQKHIVNVEEQIESLTQLKAQLEHLRHKCSKGKNGECGIIESLSDSKGCPFCEDFRCRSEQHEKQRRLQEIALKNNTSFAS